VTKVQQTGTATLTATEEDITVTGLSLDYEFEKCSMTVLQVEGNPTVTVDDPGSIGEATFSAGALEIYNAKSETVGTASAEGSASASPSGTYQLTPDEGPPTEGGGTTFTSDGEEVEVEEGFAGTGSLYWTFTLPGPTHVKLGPCEVHVQGHITSSESAHIDQFTTTTPCWVYINGVTACEITAKSANTAEPPAGPGPWPLTLTGGGGASIENANFTETLNAECPLGPGFGVSGTLTGEFEGAQIVFENSGHLANGPLNMTQNGLIVLATAKGWLTTH
jgi:hypothetical protein